MQNEIPIIGSADRLPPTLGDLNLEGIAHYPDPNMGVQIRYGIEPLVRADAYLYDLGLGPLPDDLESAEFAGWFNREVQVVMAAGEQGLVDDLELVASGFVRVPAENSEPLCLCASFTCRQDTDVPVPAFLQNMEDMGPVTDLGLVASVLALRVDGGYFNKVRLNYPAEIGEHGFAGFVKFMVAWTEFLKSGTARG